MSDIVIRAENVSKAYQIGQIGTGTVSRDIERFVRTRMLKQEDPFLKIGETNDRSVKGSSDIVWSLRDLNFEISQGDAVGIIGKNGAGKSTLLKLLSRVTSPTTGQIKVKGRIASLLEVGTGFHPELTGRENIYLNGAILGMRKKEITRKLDEIIDFSGVERYIDTPVKRYSSGMYVRLAFAVAAHLESEILIVDEVLAVGDADFQKKCLGKMGDISKGQGRTVLFVSHNMAAVQTLCSSSLVLQNGLIKYAGDVQDGVVEYLKLDSTLVSVKDITDRSGNGIVKVISATVYGETRDSVPQVGSAFNFELEFENPQRLLVKDLRCDIRIDDQMGQRLLWLSNTVVPLENTHEILDKVTFTMDRLSLNTGTYYISVWIAMADGKTVVDWLQNAISFQVDTGDFYGTGRTVQTSQSRLLADFKVNFNSSC